MYASPGRVGRRRRRRLWGDLGALPGWADQGEKIRRRKVKGGKKEGDENEDERK